MSASPLAPAIAALAVDIAKLTSGRVAVDESVADRSGELDLKPPGLWSPNRNCRMVQATDGWIAVNLPREDDRDLIAAWTSSEWGAEPWPAILAHAGRTPRGKLIEDARLLGLPVAAVGEVAGKSLKPPFARMAPKIEGAWQRSFHVIDLSSMWAGPLCGSVLAQAGFSVMKVESASHADTVREATPGFFQRLNNGKSHSAVDLADEATRDWLFDEVAIADVLITSARPRAFETLGLSPKTVFAENPGLVWVAITGYGWSGDHADRVAFGDDAAAAGGLVRWEDSEPRFAGDALADPVTGLAAAAGALRALEMGGGLLVDAALAPCAAGAAAA